jgi:hypothetical protein
MTGGRSGVFLAAAKIAALKSSHWLFGLHLFKTKSTVTVDGGFTRIKDTTDPEYKIDSGFFFLHSPAALD